MANDYTQLNQGTGGDYMDESSFTYLVAPTTRKRPRVVIGGEGDKDQLVNAPNAPPGTADYGLTVRPVPFTRPHPGSPVCQLASATLVASGVETTVASYTVSTGKTLYLAGGKATGDVDAKFIFYIAGVAKVKERSSVAWPNVEMTFLGTFPAALEGETVTIRVLHTNPGLQGNFDATILGYEVNN